MRKKGNASKYSEHLRQQIVHVYYTSDASIRTLARDFDVPRSTVEKWVQNGKANYKVEHDIQKEIRTFASVTNSQTTMPQKKLSQEEMAKRIKELEAELEYERMRANTYDTMINLAEDMFKIPIRKKSGAKQSKK